ncbi:hypothetical protein O6H91_01G176400 [Diphasiastrum complanatum]|uniref:Uncharacterized protein n=1 Tax=Diphasiastrum complanatum TaxID=34168 RepID=A0ACC2EZ99_DIPCM|nr:hypothetical protein O6H91_01G176400 [Diphasiastrum complanatum]
MLRGDKLFILWIAKEVWMTQLVEASCVLLDGILGNPFGEVISLPVEPSLSKYFDEIRSTHRAALFDGIVKDMVDV